MNIKEIREIIELMKENNINEFMIERDGLKISLKRGLSGEFQPVITQEVRHVPAQSQTKETETATQPKENIAYITSPMVGTFYVASSPDAAPFVGIGSNVEENSPVCIVEAMKVMNEIKSEIRGKIKEVLVKNGEAVEFGQPLFAVEK